MIGQTISHYRIIEKLGEGGMGVVYRAQDVKLDRTVALKFLSSQALGDGEEKARFLREAQALAALNHPNICMVHEIDEVGGQTFLVMAYIEGENLSTRIGAGPLKLEEALDIAAQVARGLAAAHEKGVVNRDVKSSNIMLPAGRGRDEIEVKILDFGLAQLAGRSKISKAGATLGTAAYMSPEQTSGEEVDQRADVWALGVVLYEMVTGQLPFKGHYEQALMYSILNEEPEPITALRTGVPMELERVVNKALSKRPDERYQHADEMLADLRALRRKIELEKSAITRTQMSGIQSAVEGQRLLPRLQDSIGKLERRRRLLQVGLVVLSVLLVTATVVIVWQLRSFPASDQPARATRFAFTPGNDVRHAVVSPNGRHIAYVAGQSHERLWIQDLDREEPREMHGTEGARNPFWSPDSASVGFVSGIELKRVSLPDSTPISICRMRGAPANFSATWSPDGSSIVWSGRFSPGGPPRLYEVSAQGGRPELLIEPKEAGKDKIFVSPHFLPLEAGNRKLLFSIGQQTATQVVVQDLETGQREELVSGAYAVYSPSGHVLYQPRLSDSSALWALPFSVEKLKPTGKAFPIAQNASLPGVSQDGTLVYLDSVGRVQLQLVWRSRNGEEMGKIGQPQQNILYASLSPDGRFVATRGWESDTAESDVWLHDVAQPIKTRLTFAPAHDTRPLWSPTGDEVAFASKRRGNYDIFVKRADGSGESKALVATPLYESPEDWSPDGKHLVYRVDSPETGGDLWYLKSGEGSDGFEAVPYLQTRFQERQAKFSPDGRFLAYCSDESGEYEVYVRTFPDGGGKQKVSRNGATQPRWSRDGTELFYVEGDTLVAVSVTLAPTFAAKSVTRLFRSLSLVGGSTPNYDVSADGTQFVLAEPVGGTRAPAIRVVQNWFAEF